MTKTNAVIAFFGAFFVVLIIVLSLPPAGKPLSAEQIQILKKRAMDAPYDMLARQSGDFKNYEIVLQGKVVQAFDSMLRVDMRWDNPYNRSGNEIVWVDYKPAGERILEGDKVKVWGVYTGIRSYKAVLGQTIEIPHVVAAIVESQTK